MSPSNAGTTTSTTSASNYDPNDPNQDTGSGTKHYKLILTIWL